MRGRSFDVTFHVTLSSASATRVWRVLFAALLLTAGTSCRYHFDQVGDVDAGDGSDAGALPDDGGMMNAIDAGDPGTAMPVQYGTGSAGPLDLTQGALQVNDYAAVVGDVARQSYIITTDRPLVASAGSLALLWQHGSTAPAASGVQTSIVLDTSAVAQWEFVRLAAIDLGGTKIELETGTQNEYKAGATQLVTVPEYTTVAIGADAAIVAQPWDGEVGGILAFLVAGSLDVAGVVSASGAGYRGGIAVPTGDESLGSCVGLDELAPGGEAKGEGLLLGRYGPDTTGRGNLANGGGGGSCHNNGAAGGGHQGAGGAGGIVDYEDPTQPPALGGAATQASSIARLSMGGGGGAGECHHGTAADGGRGGGVILLGAQRIGGLGIIEANGIAAPSAGTNGDGGGGGGAGGAIYIRSDEIAGCKSVSVGGGAGADSEAGASGGGGGGGRIVAPPLPCTTLVLGGEPGLGSNSAEPGRGGDGAILSIAPGGF
jgi:hypothetical protein